ncbi:hypothetical protein [Corallococcus sp. AB038B]|uniref:hypothetical protein n=1 Tax=Corallococcus sp. AB038B TaxID=2316718 RepID=UPI001F20D2AD|nr:hypothetical protein [Corallococcus sp. AB038B]
MRGMKREALVLVLGLVWAVMACGGETPETGSARLVAMVQSASAASITQVTVGVSGPGMAPITGALAKDGSGWSGTVSSIPVGNGREFVAKAFDAAGVLRFEGRASGVTIGAGQTTVMLTLQDLEPPPPFDNDAPVIQSLTVSSSTVAPGGEHHVDGRGEGPQRGGHADVRVDRRGGHLQRLGQRHDELDRAFDGGARGPHVDGARRPGRGGPAERHADGDDPDRRGARAGLLQPVASGDAHRRV